MQRRESVFLWLPESSNVWEAVAGVVVVHRAALPAAPR